MDSRWKELEKKDELRDHPSTITAMKSAEIYEMISLSCRGNGKMTGVI